MTDELSWEAVLAWRVWRQRLAERAPAEDWLAAQLELVWGRARS